MKYILPIIAVLLLILFAILATKDDVELGAEVPVVEQPIVETKIIEETPEYRIIENGKTVEKIYK